MPCEADCLTEVPDSIHGQQLFSRVEGARAFELRSLMEKPERRSDTSVGVADEGSLGPIAVRGGEKNERPPRIGGSKGKRPRQGRLAKGFRIRRRLDPSVGSR